MADGLSVEKRSWNMSRIRNKDTRIEWKVRRYLFRQGFRYRKNVTSMAGKPDIMLPKYKTLIFIHGCFWHRHAGCKDATTPKTRADFWIRKFDQNIINNRKHERELKSAGWHVIVLWECEINKTFEATMHSVCNELKRHSSTTLSLQTA